MSAFQTQVENFMNDALLPDQVEKFDWQLIEETEIYLVAVWMVPLDPNYPLTRKQVIAASLAYRLAHLLRWEYSWGKVRAEIFRGQPSFAVMLKTREEILNVKSAVRILRLTDNLVNDYFEVRQSSEKLSCSHLRIRRRVGTSKQELDEVLSTARNYFGRLYTWTYDDQFVLFESGWRAQLLGQRPVAIGV
jgi:hypothetical protein